MNWRGPCAAALCLALAGQAAACTTDAMVVFDASASMNSQGFDATTTRRIDEARAAVAEVLPRIEHARRIGLLTYGPGAGPCDGISLRFAPIERAAARLVAEVEAVRPGGRTPLTRAVRAAIGALPAGPGIVVLVTDGHESCGGAPCALALPPDITVHVIGFKLVWTAFARRGDGLARPSDGEGSARCLAERSGGRFVSTETVGELSAALGTALGCVVVGGMMGATGRATASRAALRLSGRM